MLTVGMAWLKASTKWYRVSFEGMGLVSSSLHQPGSEQAFSMEVEEVVPSLTAPVTRLVAPRDLPSHCAFALLQRKAGGPEAGEPGSTNTHLDVHSLAQLRSSSVPATDDSAKYSYTLGQHGQYGECLPLCRASSAGVPHMAASAFLSAVGMSLGRLWAGNKAELWVGTTECSGETGTVDFCQR